MIKEQKTKVVQKFLDFLRENHITLCKENDDTAGYFEISYFESELIEMFLKEKKFR
jgi:hypothetical protein